MSARTSLLIMAAGIGSRFGGGIKQLAPVDDSNHIIMDYSIHDAIEAGFNQIIFIIRKDIETDFREVIGNRIETICQKHGVDVAYTFQSLEDLPAGVTLPEGREKPWGTGQAVLSARDIIQNPFAVLNADDYYGKDAFRKLHDYLVSQSEETAFCMPGFILKNTLSEHGGVTRGICKVDADNYLIDVVETSDIVKTEGGAAVHGVPVDLNAYVSMNMWGLTPKFMEILKEGLVEFFQNTAKEDLLKAEYLLPIYIGQLLREGRVSVKVLETQDQWFGFTYKEDTILVQEKFRALIEKGVYQKDLFSDLTI